MDKRILVARIKSCYYVLSFCKDQKVKELYKEEMGRLKEEVEKMRARLRIAEYD